MSVCGPDCRLFLSEKNIFSQPPERLYASTAHFENVHFQNCYTYITAAMPSCTQLPLND